jgi:hypothetical protein
VTARSAFLSIATLFAVLVTANAARAEVPVNHLVRHMAPGDALMLVHSHVPEIATGCKLVWNQSQDPISSGIRGTLSGTCLDEALKAKLEAALLAIDVAPPTQRFHVVVLGASRKGGGPAPDLMPSESKALADFAKVMTYKSFHLDAEAVLNVARDAEAQLSDAFQLNMLLEPMTSGGGSITVQSFRLRAARPQQMPNGTAVFATYVETSFSINRGETIVLGASTSDQEARVVLVTALP